MKLAKEIAEAIGCRIEAESIIAAKLAPVREALALAYEHTTPDDVAMPFLQTVRDALALLEDDDEKNDSCEADAS